MRLVLYSHLFSDGTSGKHYSLIIRYTYDGKCKVSSCSISGANSTAYAKNYYAEGLLDKIGEVCARYNVAEYNNLPITESDLADAPTENHSFIFENGLSVALESDRQWPQNGSALCTEIAALIAESETYGIDDELTEEELSRSPKNGGMFYMRPLKQVKVNK